MSFVKTGIYFRLVKNGGALMLLEIGQHIGYFSVNGENAKPEGNGKQTNYKR